jgi:hypothetical protein
MELSSEYPLIGQLAGVSDHRVKQFLPDAKIWRLGRPGKLRGNETENVFLSWLGWLY